MKGSDSRNANKGTERGLALLDKSLRQYGAGRSILVDKNGRVIAGNKTLYRYTLVEYAADRQVAAVDTGTVRRPSEFRAASDSGTSTCAGTHPRMIPFALESTGVARPCSFASCR